MTQHEKILILMRKRGLNGINSFDARRELNIIQLPARIKELKELGHDIIIRQRSNKSVDYILNEKRPIAYIVKDKAVIGLQETLF